MYARSYMCSIVFIMCVVWMLTDDVLMQFSTVGISG